TSVCIVLDQLTKYLVVKFIKGSKPLVIAEDLLSFVYVENRGAAFGILQNKKWLFIVVTIISVTALLYLFLFHYKKMSTWLIVSLSFVLGGTIGNFIDRMRLDYVVDFISVRIMNRYDFAVFNIADSFIVIGAIMLMIHIIFLDSKG
ncbi:MAG: signal peptidase II, partial [Tissierellia bacterium]|nr:signal peptidase II [Tissierellia bacterium]